MHQRCQIPTFSIFGKSTLSAKKPALNPPKLVANPLNPLILAVHPLHPLIFVFFFRTEVSIIDHSKEERLHDRVKEPERERERCAALRPLAGRRCIVFQ